MARREGGKMTFDPIPSFMVQAVADAIPVVLTEPVIEPKVATDGVAFSPEVDARIRLQYADRALVVNTFELFMDLLQDICNNLQLVPATDLPKIAALLNAMRIEKGLAPL